MTIREIYEHHCANYLAWTSAETKFEWAASEIFDLTTYDGELDELFVKKILEVLHAILERTTFEYIKDRDNYITYILVCQMLEQFHWIEWGTSIRGAWFETYHYNQKTRPILKDNLEIYGVEEIPCTAENLKALIEFLESEDE